ncbi:hypothetical protein L1987_83916 [Smallanthus sonchifolius]|uniref:Uncharacterized protein n=1 Tax=Smallanthus sonchifolius TaxID=185202 RepID=A0ACB8YE67_9ASTR|nr:hypothetical protein L1987_83916 [Smallanthus sonchifolius]
MLSLQSDPRQVQQQQLAARVSYNNGDHQRDSLYVLSTEIAHKLSHGLESREATEEMVMSVAHQSYKSGDFRLALDRSKAVYDRNPMRLDNLLLLGAIYYQFDLCITKNEEALRIDRNFAECYGNMANAWKEKGNIVVAIRYYLVAIELRPNFADAWSNLGSGYMRKGRLTEATQCCRQALTLNPHLVGNLMKAQGLVQEAYNCYLEALRIQPTFAIAWSNLAGLFMESGDLSRALQYYKEAVKLKPTFADAYLNLGNLYKCHFALHRLWEWLLKLLSVISEQSKLDYAMAFGNLASIYYEQGNLEIAINHYKQAIALDTGFLEAYNNLGNALKDAGKVEEAIRCYRQCLSLQPSHPQALANLGNIYMEWNMMTAAAQCYKATLSVTTGLSAPFNKHAIIYKQQGNYADVISCHNEVLRIDPLAADGLVNRGNTYKEIGRVSEAIQDYSHAIVIHPNMAEAHANLASAYKDSGHVEAAIKSYKQALAIRPDFPEATCLGIVQNLLETSVIPSVQPFHAIAYPLDPMLALEISRKYAAHCSVIAGRFSLPAFNHPLPLQIKSTGGNKRLKIGEWRIRIQSEAEHFTDVSAMTSDMIAQGARNEIFAMQPAPIQVSYMGFPGTTGANYIQYLVTDEFVSPLKFSHIYSEKLVHVPHCYFVNDYKQKNLDVLDPNCRPKRSAYGLPEDKFIFGCFNQLYKMDPEIFMTWCNILKRVPNSALWLLRFPASGEMRLRAYQIIFTDVATKNEHIRRCSLADLCLDTPLCNAHTTGTDVLWAGLPMVTLPLEKMATRVAGSLYRAVYLALNPAKLQDLTERLKSSRLNCPLFDTSRWVRNLERAYLKMWNIYCGGQQAQHFKVKEDDSEYPYDH